MRTALIVLVVALVGCAFANLAPVILATENGIEGSYIVVYHSNVTLEELDADMVRVKAVHAVQVKRTYRTAMKGFHAHLNARQLAALRTSSRVEYIEQDQVMSAVQCQTQNDADWGLTRVSQKTLDLDDTYAYPGASGSGVTAYIIDTGVLLTHTDFQGRATFGFKAETTWSNEDRNGHGTHVASTVAGLKYGVAKKADLVAVKVLGDDGSGTTAGVISGVDWALADHIKKMGKPGVANMSLGGGRSTALNNACNYASNEGLIMVVAAGNDNNNACNGSPSGATTVITTGATDIGASGSNQIDVRSYFSNFGTCVHIFAPGSNILGAWIGGNTATRTISGTSMASPHVCGVAALYVGQNPSASFAEVKAHIQGTSTKDMITMNCSGVCGASVNYLLWNGCRN